jgi:hypothetical protein
MSVSLRIRLAACFGFSSSMDSASLARVCIAFSIRLSSNGKSSGPPSSLARPVKAKADIIRDNGPFLHLGHLGLLDVLMAREKKLKMVLQSLQ